MKNIIPKRILDVMNIIANNGYKSYLVGGCVRDYIMGVPPHDYDITTSADINALQAIFKDYKLVNKNGIKHNTLSIYYEHDIIEITSFKVKSDALTIEEDLKNRDLTINAIAYSAIDGFIDPFNGKGNIDNKIIRVCNDEAFKDDYLRILRALRFSSIYDFKIDEYTKKLIKRDYEGLKNIKAERINKELCNILIGKNVKNILLEYDYVFSYVIPELKLLIGFDQKSKYHLNDIYTHTVNVVSNTRCDVNTRVAALLHDIGKPDKFTVDENGNGHFYMHNLKGVDISRVILNRLRFSNDDKDEILYLIENHDVMLNDNKKRIKKLIIKAPYNSIESFTKLVDLRNSDNLDHINTANIDVEGIMKSVNELIEENACLTVKDLRINGRDLQLLGFIGKDIGLALKSALTEVVEERLENDYDKLIEYVKKLK